MTAHLTLLSLLVFIVAVVSSQQFKTEYVSFPSEGASGKLMMHGTLYSPVNQQSNTVIVLMHGSGASSRDEVADMTYWNTDAKPNALKPACGVQTIKMSFFKQVAEYLASIGYSVLAYDKRGCCSEQYKDYCTQCQIVLGHFTDTCYYACSPNDPPQQLNLNKLTVYDEATDAANAMLFLQREYQFKNLVVVGHSQGVNLAPLAVNQYLNYTIESKRSLNLTHLVLLGGGLTPFDDFLVDQLHRREIRAKELEVACINDPNAPLSKDLILNMQYIENQMQKTIPIAIDFFAKLKQGIYPPDQVYSLDFTFTGYYMLSSINTSTPIFFERQIFADQLKHTKIMSINSPTDMNVNEQDYKPLIDILKKRSLLVPIYTEASVIPYTTHFMTNASLSSTTPLITEEFKKKMYEFLSL